MHLAFDQRVIQRDAAIIHRHIIDGRDLAGLGPGDGSLHFFGLHDFKLARPLAPDRQICAEDDIQALGLPGGLRRAVTGEHHAGHAVTDMPVGTGLGSGLELHAGASIHHGSLCLEVQSGA